MVVFDSHFRCDTSCLFRRLHLPAKVSCLLLSSHDSHALCGLRPHPQKTCSIVAAATAKVLAAEIPEPLPGSKVLYPASVKAGTDLRESPATCNHAASVLASRAGFPP
jgi:hypothetical protein